MQRTGIAVLALAAVLLVAGCSGAGSGGADVEQRGPSEEARGGDAAVEATQTQIQTAAAEGKSAEYAAEDAPSDGGAAGEASDGGDGGDATARQSRALIRTGRVVLRVERYGEARSAIVTRVDELGGFLAGASVETNRAGNRTWRTGEIVVRVPAEKFPAAMTAVKSQGAVLSAETRTRDVTDRLVDLEARLKNLRAERDRLRNFLERANDTDELLAVERRLTEVQGEIERLEAQKRNLEKQVAMSTVRVQLREPRPDPPEPTTTTPTPYHDRSVTGAFVDSVVLLIRLGKSFVVTLAYLGPFLLLAGLPIAFGLLAYRRGVFGGRR